MRLQQSEQRQHAAGSSFFGAVRIVNIDMASCADAAVIDIVQALCATLFDNLRCEIDLVMRRTNTGTELHDQIARVRSKARRHLGDGIRDDAELGSFASRMHKTDGRRFWIDNINGAAVGNINAHRDTVLIGDNAVAAGKMFVFAADTAAPTVCKIDDCDFIAVNLLGSKQRPIAESSGMTNLLVRFL